MELSSSEVSPELIGKIRRCERAYIECFSKSFENDRVIRYRDDNLSDMYDHNCTYIKGAPPLNELLQIIDNEIKLYKTENRDYIKILMDEMPYENGLEGQDVKLQIEHYGQYVYPSAGLPGWSVGTDCEILKVNGPSAVDDLVFLDREQYGEVSGEDFCIRRARRRGQVFLSNTSIDSYICYYEGEAVGNCDLFLSDGMAKIEDFTVLPKYQRRGLGSAILKHLISSAFSRGVRTIYLTTDEDDTPKDMYMKLGFKKVSDSFALFGRP